MTDKLDFKTEYKKIQKKYNLPEFDLLNKEFELGELEKKDFLLRVLRRKMRDKLIFFCRIIEGILYPTDRSPLLTYESGFFDENLKENLMTLHKTMMLFDRQSLLLEVEATEAKDIEFILKLWKEWPQFKRELIKVIVVMEHSWLSTTQEQKTEGYFG